MHFAAGRRVVFKGLLFRLLAAVLLSACALGAQAQNKCSATGLMAGERFVANNCAASVFEDEHSVAIWFSEQPISAAEAEQFRISASAHDSKDGKQRTLIQITFCPGGGGTRASVTAVKSINLSTNNAKLTIPPVQWIVESPKDFKVEKMTGEVKPGGTLAGKIIGSRDRWTWNLEFDVRLPEKDGLAGLSCGK
jgi:hypothetical protein